MKCWLLLLSLFLFSKPMRAQEASDKMYHFSEDVRDILVKAPGGHPMPNGEFNLTTAAADQMKALAFLDDSMRSHIEDASSKNDCDKSPLDPSLKKRIDKRPFQLEAVVFTSDAKFEQNALGSFMTDDYMNYMGQLSQNGNLKSYDIYSIDMLMNKYKLDHPEMNFDAISFSEKENILNHFAEDYLGTKLPPGLLMKEMAFQQMINNATDWKSTLAVAKDKLSNQQKIELVSKFGGIFGNNYNHDRANGGSSSSGFVDTTELLNSAKNMTPGGVCRDIALAQIQILKELGFDKSYVLTYKTLDSGHATVITTDPSSGKVIKFNYQETYESKKGSGTEVLVQDSSIPDHGLEYSIYDSNGKPVTQVASELSQILKESTGGTVDRDFSPRNFSLTNVGFKSGSVNGNLFSGKTSAGENVYGVALNKNFKIGNYLTVGAGTSFSKLEGTRSFYKIEQESLYARLSAELQSPKISLGQVKASAFLGTSGETIMSHNKDTSLLANQSSEAGGQFDGNAEVHLGVQNTFKSTNGKFSIDNKVYTNFYPDWVHVADEGKRGLAFDSLIVKTGVTQKLTDDTKALLDTAVILKKYGTSMVMKASLEDEKHQSSFSAGVAVPLTKDMPTFLPGGEKRAFVGMEKMTKKMIFTIMYERNFDNSSNNLMIKAQVKF